MFLFSLMFPHKYVWGLRQEKRARKSFSFVRSLYSFSVARNWRSKRARGKSFRLHLCSVAYTGESKVLSPLENVEKARKMFQFREGSSNKLPIREARSQLLGNAWRPMTSRREYIILFPSTRQILRPGLGPWMGFLS